MIIKDCFSKFKDNSRTNCTFLEFQEFSRTKVIFKDFSRSVQTLLLHSEWPKLHRVLAILSAIGFNQTTFPSSEVVTFKL